MTRSVAVLGPGPDSGYGLEFGPADLVRTGSADPAAATRLVVPADVADRVAAGADRGSGVVMSGAVRVSGDLVGLGGLAPAMAAPVFRAHVAGRSPGGLPAPVPAGPDRPLVLVAGAPNDASGRLGVAARDRCAAALALCRERPEAQLVLSGGFGAQFNTTSQPHWRHCERWIAGRPGRPVAVAARIEPSHTYEELHLLRALALARRPSRVTVVTSAYHAVRTRFLLDLLLPSAEVHPVPHPGLAPRTLGVAVRHERTALAGTVAATILFGADLPPAARKTPTGGRHPRIG